MAQPRIELGPTTERPGFGPGNTLITFVDVSFTIVETGDTGMVSVPSAQFSSDIVREQIMVKVTEIMKLRTAFGG